MSRITCLRMLLVVLIAAIMPIAYAAAPKSAPPSPAARFADYGHPGTFLLQRDGAAVQVIHGGDRAAKALSPASTIKPLLALIALETGVLDGADEIVPWDGRNYPHSPEWQTGMALRRAMQTSNESYFRVLATRIGHDRLAEWVKRIGYGNGHIGDSAVDAWHDGVLTITAQQQLAFIDHLRRSDLPFATSNIATVKAAMLDSDRQGIRIYGKTGTHLDNSSTGNAWWIGWVEGGKTPATSFVLGAELQTMDKREKRIALGKALLRDAGVLPAN